MVDDVLQFAERKRKKPQNGVIIRKFIDGEFVDYVDFDMLSVADQRRLLDSNSERLRG